MSGHVCPSCARLRPPGTPCVCGQAMSPHAAALLYILAADGRTSAPALIDALGMEKTGVHRHLTHLHRLGLVAVDVVRDPGTVGAIARSYTATAAGVAWAVREQVPA